MFTFIEDHWILCTCLIGAGWLFSELVVARREATLRKLSDDPNEFFNRTEYVEHAMRQGIPMDEIRQTLDSDENWRYFTKERTDKTV